MPSSNSVVPIRRKRILHLIDSGGVYGAERVILNLSGQLLQRTEYEPIVGCIVPSGVTTSPLYEAARLQGIEAILIPLVNWRLLIDIPRASRQLRSLGIDLIHSHGYKPSICGFLVCLLLAIPIIATCHLWFDPSSGPVKMRVMIRIEKFFYRWFPRVIAVSEPIKAELLASGLPGKIVAVVPNGVDFREQSRKEADARQLREALRLGVSDFVVLNTARLTRQKAQWTLVEAARILRDQGQPVQFLIVGEGELVDDLRQQVSRHGLDDCVHLLGFRSDVASLLAMADVFALPSIDEGMPMSLLEATAAARPIIATLVGDVGKLIVHEVSGLLVPLEDPDALASAVKRLRYTPQLAHDLARCARDKAFASYSSSAMCGNYSRIYDEVLESCE